MTNLDKFVISTEASIGDALRAIDAGASSIALAIDSSGRLVGAVTDGDVRRALLGGATLDDSAYAIVNRNPHTVGPSVGRAQVLDLMNALRITSVPIVDESGSVVGLHTLSNLIGPRELPNSALIMAGGKGTRLGALTKNTPKPLMEVAGRPIIEWIILGLIEGGIRRIYISVAYLAQMIKDRLGDGSRLGAQIHYLDEDPDNPLDTAGAVSQLKSEYPMALEHPLVVTNGDLMVRYNVADLLSSHAKVGAAITIATRVYEHQVPFGVLQLDSEGLVQDIHEKPLTQSPISSGVYVLSNEAAELVPLKRSFSMPDLISRCIQEDRRVSSWSIEGEWIDVGTPQDLAKAQGR